MAKKTNAPRLVKTSAITPEILAQAMILAETMRGNVAPVAVANVAPVAADNSIKLSDLPKSLPTTTWKAAGIGKSKVMRYESRVVVNGRVYFVRGGYLA